MIYRHYYSDNDNQTHVNTDQQIHWHIHRLSVQNIPAVYEPMIPAQVSTYISSSGKPIHYHYEAFHFGCTISTDIAIQGSR